MARNRKAGLDPSSLISIVEKTDSVQDLLREARNLPLEKIQHNPDQPRQTFDPVALNELKASIEQLGVMVPLLVRPVELGYQIICGERRFRAAQELKLATVPAIVRKADDFTTLKMAYEENVKREDLTSLDEARFLNGLIDRGFVKSRQDLAEQLGVSKGRVTQKLAVLKLSAPVQEAFATHHFLGELHARSLAQIDDPKLQERTLTSILSRELSGRQAEALVKRHLERPPVTRTRRNRVMFGDTVIRRDAAGFALFLPASSGPKLADLLESIAAALREHKLSLPPPIKGE